MLREPHHHAIPRTLRRAREMRKDMPRAEVVLWMRLRSKQLAGLRFRRQQPIGQYIADFICAEAKLVIELDGASHAGRCEYDEERSRHLRAEGFDVIRLDNEDVLYHLDAVVDQVRSICEARRL
ncbi:MAG: endonuclease domain-containing protein [Tepidisphaeraceae bacterium]